MELLFRKNVRMYLCAPLMWPFLKHCNRRLLAQEIIVFHLKVGQIFTACPVFIAF